MVMQNQRKQFGLLMHCITEQQLCGTEDEDAIVPVANRGQGQAVQIRHDTDMEEA